VVSRNVFSTDRFMKLMSVKHEVQQNTWTGHIMDCGVVNDEVATKIDALDQQQRGNPTHVKQQNRSL